MQLFFRGANLVKKNRKKKRSYAKNHLELLHAFLVLKHVISMEAYYCCFEKKFTLLSGKKKNPAMLSYKIGNTLL